MDANWGGGLGLWTGGGVGGSWDGRRGGDLLFLFFGEALVACPQAEGLGPGQAGGLGDGLDLAGFLDQGDGVVDSGGGFGGWRLGRCVRPGAAGVLDEVEATLGFVGFTAEADGAAAQAEHAVERHVGRGGLAERGEGVEAEADDLGGEAEFVLGLRLMFGEHADGGVAGRVGVVGGAGEEQQGQARQDGVQDGGWEVGVE
jgi:hypothetical protein